MIAFRTVLIRGVSELLSFGSGSVAMLPVTHGLSYHAIGGCGRGIRLPVWQCDLAMWLARERQNSLELISARLGGGEVEAATWRRSAAATVAGRFEARRRSPRRAEFCTTGKAWGKCEIRSRSSRDDEAPRHQRASADKVQKHGVEAVAAAKIANSTSASGDCLQIELGYLLYISVTFAWFDRPVSLTTSGRSIKVETVNSSPAPFGKNSANFLRTPKAAKWFGGRS